MQHQQHKRHALAWRNLCETCVTTFDASSLSLMAGPARVLMAVSGFWQLHDLSMPLSSLHGETLWCCSSL
jgi:hypothetical protein